MFGILAFAEGAFAELTETGNIEVSATGVNATGGTGAVSAQGTTLIIPSSVTATTSVGDETVVINVAIATTGLAGTSALGDEVVVAIALIAVINWPFFTSSNSSQSIKTCGKMFFILLNKQSFTRSFF